MPRTEDRPYAAAPDRHSGVDSASPVANWLRFLAELLVAERLAELERGESAT